MQDRTPGIDRFHAALKEKLKTIGDGGEQDLQTFLSAVLGIRVTSDTPSKEKTEVKPQDQNLPQSE